MENQTGWKIGTQIAFLPAHANGDIKHPSVEFGFITSGSQGFGFFCRFWHKGKPGELRTTANSEYCPTMQLVKHKSVGQSSVRCVLEKLYFN